MKTIKLVNGDLVYSWVNDPHSLGHIFTWLLYKGYILYATVEQHCIMFTLEGGTAVTPTFTVTPDVYIHPNSEPIIVSFQNRSYTIHIEVLQYLLTKAQENIKFTDYRELAEQAEAVFNTRSSKFVKIRSIPEHVADVIVSMTSTKQIW